MVVLKTKAPLTAPWRTKKQQKMVLNKYGISFVILNWCNLLRASAMNDPGHNQTPEPENPGPAFIVRSSSVTISEHA